MSIQQSRIDIWQAGSTRPIREEYLIVQGGRPAGTGARSYQPGGCYQRIRGSSALQDMSKPGTGSARIARAARRLPLARSCRERSSPRGHGESGLPAPNSPPTRSRAGAVLTQPPGALQVDFHV
jgi:hypothetical protein